MSTSTYKSHLYLEKNCNQGAGMAFLTTAFRLEYAHDFLKVKHNWSLRLVHGQRTGLSLPTAFYLSLTLICAGGHIDFHDGFMDRWFRWFSGKLCWVPGPCLQVKATSPPLGEISQLKDSLLSRLQLLQLAAEGAALLMQPESSKRQVIRDSGILTA